MKMICEIRMLRKLKFKFSSMNSNCLNDKCSYMSQDWQNKKERFTND